MSLSIDSSGTYLSYLQKTQSTSSQQGSQVQGGGNPPPPPPSDGNNPMMSDLMSALSSLGISTEQLVLEQRYQHHQRQQLGQHLHQFDQLDRCPVGDAILCAKSDGDPAPAGRGQEAQR